MKWLKVKPTYGKQSKESHLLFPSLTQTRKNEQSQLFLIIMGKHAGMRNVWTELLLIRWDT